MQNSRRSPSTPQQGRRGFVSTSMAERWDAGVLVGTGRVGAVVWGGPAEHRISLAHERFFLPVNPRPLPPDLAQARRAARKALLDGDPDAAARVIDEAAGRPSDELIWTDPLAPCATLALRIHGAGSDISGYQRGVDFEAGVARVSWRSATDDVRIEVQAPRGSQRVEVVVHARPGQDVEALLAPTMASEDRAELDAERDHAIEVRASIDSGSSAAVTVAAAGLVPGTGARATTRISSTEPGTLFEARDQAVRMLVTAQGDGIVRLGLEVEVAGPGGVSPRLVDIGGHEELQRASWLDLASGIGSSMPTEDLHELAAADERVRRGLVELAYAAGRYSVISSTGELPATLQGVWQGSWAPAWSSDYTMNGNLQNGGAASLVPTGTPQLMRALARLLTAHIEDYRVNAGRLFGFEGALLPSRMSTHGFANHFSHDYPHEFWTGAGGWALRMLADAVMATGDRTLVDDHVWTLAVEIMRFYRQLAQEGRIAPGYSPENTPLRRATPLSVQPTMDAAILRDAPRAFRVLAEARGQDAPDITEYPTPAAGYRIAPDGVLAEWEDPRFEDRLEHRHSSQLYPLWYEQDEALDDPLREAALRLIRSKIAWRAADTRPPPGHMEMAFGLAQVGLAAAALGDGEAVLHCIEWLALAHFTPAMTTTHDAGEIFNVDASGALPALVAATLVQSTRSSISLLPAVPSAWPTGAAGGLSTRTALEVQELRWHHEGLTAVLHGSPESVWVRPSGVRILLPAPARRRVSSGWSHPARAFDLGEEGDRELEFRWARTGSD